MRVSDLCDKGFLIGTGPDVTLRAAALRMAEEGVGCLIVVDRSGSMTGIITDRDIVTRAVALGLDPDVTLVSDAMSCAPITVESTADIEDAAQLMREFGIRRLPVVEAHGKAIGIVTMEDILRVVASSLRELSNAVDVVRRAGIQSR
ncbi:MAG: CBS domain-containing protein [Planctomycetota bacterium]